MLSTTPAELAHCPQSRPSMEEATDRAKPEGALEDPAEEIQRLQLCVSQLTASNGELRAELARSQDPNTAQDGSAQAHLILDSIPAPIAVVARAGEVEYL